MHEFDILISYATVGPRPTPLASRALLDGPITTIQKYRFHDQIIHLDPNSRPYLYFGHVSPFYGEFAVTDLRALVKSVEKTQLITFASQKGVNYEYENGICKFRWPSGKFEIARAQLEADCLRMLKLLFDFNCKVYDFPGAGLAFDDAATASLAWEQLWDHIDDCPE